MAELWPCSVCASRSLRLHLRVAGELGTQGLIPTTSRFGTALGDIYRCPSCGHMQLGLMPTGPLLDSGYAGAASTDYVQESAGQRATARQALADIEARVGPGRLLDLGCWVGFLLAEARERGWQGVGVEPSEFASRFARDQLGLDVRTGELFSASLPAHAFDAVVMGDVIEHLPNPGAALERVSELLAPGGVLWLALPDAGSAVARVLGRRWWSVIPTHVQYFTRRSITLLLDRHGFDLLEITTAPKAFTVGYYLSRVNGYSQALGRILSSGAGTLGVAQRLWTPDFRDRMAVLAQPRVPGPAVPGPGAATPPAPEARS